MSSVVWLPSLNLLRISANCLLSLCLMISCNSNMVKSSFQRLGERAPYSESFISLNTYLSIPGSRWNKSPSAITLTPPNASFLPLISFYWWTLNKLRSSKVVLWEYFFMLESESMWGSMVSEVGFRYWWIGRSALYFRWESISPGLRWPGLTYPGSRHLISQFLYKGELAEVVGNQ